MSRKLPDEINELIRIKAYSPPISVWQKCIIPYIFDVRGGDEDGTVNSVGNLFINLNIPNIPEPDHQFEWSFCITSFTLTALKRVCKAFAGDISPYNSSDQKTRTYLEAKYRRDKWHKKAKIKQSDEF